MASIQIPTETVQEDLVIDNGKYRRDYLEGKDSQDFKAFKLGFEYGQAYVPTKNKDEFLHSLFQDIKENLV